MNTDDLYTAYEKLHKISEHLDPILSIHIDSLDTLDKFVKSDGAEIVEETDENARFLGVPVFEGNLPSHMVAVQTKRTLKVYDFLSCKSYTIQKSEV